MTENEAIKALGLGGGIEIDGRPKRISEFFEGLGIAISALKEIQQYREIGTVEQVKNQKENLNVAYQIISDYEQYGTVEEFKMAQRYMRLVNAHGTIGQVIDSCAKYEEIGTVEECREAVEKQIQKKCAIDSCPDHTHYKCPSCGQIELSIYKHGFPRLGRITKYCENCGQALIDNDLEGMQE